MLEFPFVRKYEQLQFALNQSLTRQIIWHGYRKRLIKTVDLGTLPHSAAWTDEMHRASLRQMKKIGAPSRSHIWHRYYFSASGEYFDDYLSEPFFFDRIEPQFAPRSRITKYFDKNFYDRHFHSDLPVVIARMVAGRLCGHDFSPMDTADLLRKAENHAEIVVKPSLDSGSGKQIRFVKPAELISVLAESKRRGTADLVIQEPIRQAASLALLHPSSVNTFRIMTLRFKKKIHHLSSVVRMGRSGSRIDNHSAGGLAVGVDHAGRLKKYGYDEVFRRADHHPDSLVPFEHHEIPRYADAVAMCLDKHLAVPDIDLISWDVAMDIDDRPVLVELNTNRQGIAFHQLSNGPLLGNLTQEVLAVLKR